ncbi:hypothetical protein VB713_03435 [Anabaena cylindrica UHCC 0172]|uniref:hypothetical protein n=1 Tax=Anabaena cylindrica TaxID=1165 RepID=UPI002B21037B|nr:hypothetical protein [Anabaena cylindrica]MEA5550041.1 hypothetical protein [Anabaena cylindrica UHCC 0172]
MKSQNWQGYRVIAWVGQAVLAIFVLAAAVQGKWFNALSLSFFLIVAFIFVIKDDKLPTLFDFLFVLAALLNATGWVWDLFGKPGPYDEIVHAYTTFAITLALSFLVYSSMFSLFRNHVLLYLITITSFGIAIGALWEVVEWSAGKILDTQVIESLDDTIIDLIMDSLGAAFAALISLWALRKRINRNQEANNF